MQIKKLLFNALVASAVVMAPAALSSCDDDDGSNVGGDVSNNAAETTLTGTVEGEIDASGTPSLQPLETDSLSGVKVSWSDENGNNVTVRLLNSARDSLAEGSYNATLADLENPPDSLSLESSQYANVMVEYDNNLWTPIPENDTTLRAIGSVDVFAARFTKNDTLVKATIANCSLETGNGGQNLQINGQFNFQK